MIRFLLGMVFLLTPLSLQAEPGTYPPITSQVMDTANIIPDDQENTLRQEIVAYEKRTTNHLLVYTTATLNDLPVSDYTLNLARHWSGGEKGIANGLVLLFYPGEGSPRKGGKIRIEVGTGLESIVTDAESSRIIRQVMTPIIKQDTDNTKFAGEALAAGAGALMELTKLSPEERTEFDRKAAEQARKDAAAAWDSFVTFLGFLLIFLSIVGATWFFTRKARARRKEQKQTAWRQGIAELAEKRLVAERKQAQEDEARRQQEIERKRIADLREQKERQVRLASMTLLERNLFLENERRDREAKAEQTRAALERERQNRRAQEQRRQAEELRQQAQRQSSPTQPKSSTPDLPLFIPITDPEPPRWRSDDSSGSSSSDSYSSGGGGDFAGGGSDGDI